MNVNKLITLNFERNVGSLDRIFRVSSGVAVAVAGWIFSLPKAATLPMTVFGLMWVATGVLSKCSIYYALGLSTRADDVEPVNGGPR